MNRTLIALAAAASVLPMAAHAQSSNSTINLTGNVEEACVIGQPSSVTLNLSDLTGPDGRITTALASAATAATTTINNAWCNAPSTLSLDAAPMALSPTPSYATPTGFARLLTYDAKLSGWPTELADRPMIGDSAKTTSATEPHATTAMVLNISALEALNAAGTAANTPAVLEAGAYSGSIVIAVSVQ